MILAMVVSAASGGAQAQSGGDELSLEEVLVTARKRVESVQDVPLAITPFQAEAP